MSSIPKSYMQFQEKYAGIWHAYGQLGAAFITRVR